MQRIFFVCFVIFIINIERLIRIVFHFSQNKKMFAGMDVEVAIQQIRMQLLQRQYNEHLNELIDELKGEAKVIRNEDVKL